ncbi:MAG: DUF3311 domain-containing protein [Candidatus Eremiobacteraeota bacterium]|nr:DUF3311 domain-containing protein [Candidatus Eremiobacteraeota bacterium]
MKKRAWYWLLIVPFIATLWPPFYARLNPQIFGFPFFYFYQLIWIPISAALVWIVYLATRNKSDG